MNEFLKKFDTIRFVAPWSIFRIFFENFSFFLNLNLNFELGPVWYRSKPKPGRTDLTGNRSNRTGFHRFGEPCPHPTRAPLATPSVSSHNDNPLPDSAQSCYGACRGTSKIARVDFAFAVTCRSAHGRRHRVNTRKADR